MSTTAAHRRADPEHGARRTARRACFVVLPVAAGLAAFALAPLAHAEGPGYGGSADKLSVSWASSGLSQPAPAPADSASTPASEPPTPSTTAVTPKSVPSTSVASSSASEAATAPSVATGSASPSAVSPSPRSTTVSESPSSSGSTGTSALGAALTGGLVGGHGRAVAGRPAATAPSPVAAAAGADQSTPLLSVSGVGFRGLSVVTVRVGSGAVRAVRVDQTGTLSLSIAPATSDSISVGTSVVALGRSPSGTSKILIGAVPPRPTATGPVDVVPWITVAVLLTLGLASLVNRLRVRAA